MKIRMRGSSFLLIFLAALKITSSTGLKQLLNLCAIVHVTFYRVQLQLQYSNELI